MLDVMRGIDGRLQRRVPRVKDGVYLLLEEFVVKSECGGDVLVDGVLVVLQLLSLHGLLLEVGEVYRLVQLPFDIHELDILRLHDTLIKEVSLWAVFRLPQMVDTRVVDRIVQGFAHVVFGVVRPGVLVDEVQHLSVDSSLPFLPGTLEHTRIRLLLARLLHEVRGELFVHLY
uniref:Uncharacterized protein n=1 Tax=Strombidium inclinatum TaxID=197538 RepID=A0A7S3IGE0_9SPIT